MFAVSKGPDASPKNRASSGLKVVSEESRGSPRRISEMSGGRPPYSQTNGRRSQSGPRGGEPPEAGALQHEAVVRYLHTFCRDGEWKGCFSRVSAWKGVCNELELQQGRCEPCGAVGGKGAPTRPEPRRLVVYYQQEEELPRGCEEGGLETRA
uniref:Uncharacterized protein n=1 Tax=Ixodes ricinus TaxID=34613 RepID=A0A6B0UVE7_IXORI